MLPSANEDRPGGPVPGPTEARAGEGRAESVDWAELPAAVRDRVVELVAAALGALPAHDVPRQLRPVARFAPAKRASRGAAPILSALRDSAQFRTAVLEWLREHRHDALDPNAGEPVFAAAAAVLLGEASASSRVRLVARTAQESSLRAERDAALAKVGRLEGELSTVRAELAKAREAADTASAERQDELDRLKGRLREQGVALRRARDAAEQAAADAAQADSGRDAELAALTDELARERRKAETERARADRASAEAEQARQSAREARQADEVRLGLLLDTVQGAIGGLRRELGVGQDTGVTSGARPADTVPVARVAAAAGAAVRDVAGLDRVLALPEAHLIIDGYNVTKTGYGELALSDQRDRLTHQLAALNARTGVEATVVFDGAAVVSVPVAAARGVRVLFSDPGVLADDVIRSLVGAEPEGRPIVVVTSDRAVVESVRGHGAFAVPSDVLLQRLGRV